VKERMSEKQVAMKAIATLIFESGDEGIIEKV